MLAKKNIIFSLFLSCILASTIISGAMIEDLKKSMIIDSSCIVSLLDSLKAVEIAQIEIENIVRNCTQDQKQTIAIIQEVIYDHTDCIVRELNDLLCFLKHETIEANTCIANEGKRITILQDVLLDHLKQFDSYLLEELQNRIASIMDLDTYYQKHNLSDIESIVHTLVTIMSQEYHAQATLLESENKALYKSVLNAIRSTKKIDVTLQSFFFQLQLGVSIALSDSFYALSQQLALYSSKIEHHVALLHTISSDTLKEQLQTIALDVATSSNEIVTHISLIGAKSYSMYQDIGRLIDTVRAENIAEIQEQVRIITTIQSDLSTSLSDQYEQISGLITNIMQSFNTYIIEVKTDMIYRIEIYGDAMRNLVTQIYAACTGKIDAIEQSMIRYHNARKTDLMRLCLSQMQLIYALANKGFESIQRQEYTHINQLMSIDSALSQQICAKIMTYNQRQVVGNNLISRLIQSANTLIAEHICQKMMRAREQLLVQAGEIGTYFTKMNAFLSLSLQKGLVDVSCQLASTSSELSSQIAVIQATLNQAVVTGVSHVTTEITLQNDKLLEQLTEFKADLSNLIGEQILEHDIHMTNQYKHKCEKLMDAINAENEGTQAIISRIMELEGVVIDDITSYMDDISVYFGIGGKWSTVILLQITPALAGIIAGLAPLVAEKLIV